MLSYFLVNSGDKLRDCDLNFNTEYTFKYIKNRQELIIEKNKNHLENYWGEQVENVTVIAGMNGVGKTSILELIKDRFLWGLNYREPTILVMKENNEFIMYYDEELFNDGIKINGKKNKYDVPDFFGENENCLTVELEDINLTLKIKKITFESKRGIKYSTDIQINTRIGKNHSMVFTNNYWRYSRRDRLYNENIKTKGLDYFDLTIGQRLDSLIQELIQKRSINNIISDPENIYDHVYDERFNVDYLFKLKEEDIINTIKYLKDKDNFTAINEVLEIPEEIYIYYDFLDSRERNNIFRETKGYYMRFEDRQGNFLAETLIYNFILKNKKNLNVEQSMILVILERLFTDLELMIPFKELKLEIRDKEKKQMDGREILKWEDIKELINNFNILINKSIESLEENEVIKEKVKRNLNKRINKLFESNLEFIEYLKEKFLSKINKGLNTFEVSTFLFEYNAGNELEEHLEMSVPIIKIDKENNEIALEFFEEYSKVSSVNKPFYFVWRELSAGEIALLNLFTSICVCIEKTNKKEVIILLDEVETGLHPMLQKKFMNLLIHILNIKGGKEGVKFQIILTTHSPFVISELPTNSLILLEKDSLSKIKTVNNLENLTNTLGANIHELFSHSFFLIGGLIGDYAKHKINEVAHDLLGINSNLNQDYIKKFINQVGEPLIKTRLLELCEQKWTLEKNDDIEKVKKDIKILQSKLKKLEERDE